MNFNKVPIKSYKIAITGLVQGVGFRPFVYVLANTFNLKGTVSNNENGVIICVSGIASNIHSFYKRLVQYPPKLSKIKTHQLTEISHTEFEDFSIVPSQKSGKLNLSLTSDFAICEDCKIEILDITNKRYHYPFTTCVNCGPRWAITNTFPFERKHTTMDAFHMCDACKNEYTDPNNRRFHSQTNSCGTCGIQMSLCDTDGKEQAIDNSQIFTTIAKLIREGQIIAIKNTAGYLLCCDARNGTAVKTLRQRKNRPQKPFAILYPSLNLLKDHMTISVEQAEALTSLESPIVIIPKENYSGPLALEEITPNLNQLGVMLPYTPLLLLLADQLECPIVATSGNIHNSPIISSSELALKALKSVADYFLNHNLSISNPQDDSVIKFSKKYRHKVLFRRSRGYAPNYFGTFKADEKILAMGAHLKSAVAFLPNDYVYISQYLGNLDHADVYNRLTETVSKFITLFEEKPSVILVDAHPTYHSTQYGKELAQNLGVPSIQIQHHKAHLASVLGEHQLFDKETPILGVIWDGTGYGDDGHIWGGEFFEYDSHEIHRISHFEYYDWLAGDKMSKEPRLSLLALATDDLMDEVLPKFTNEEVAVYQTIKKQNRLKTSSVGRLFDAVASLLDICNLNTYEGEAAITLENQIHNYDMAHSTLYASILDNGMIPSKDILRKIYFDLKKGVNMESIIVNFLYTLANIIFQMADRQNIRSIVLSGGVFQNTVLIDMLKEMAKLDYKLYFNRNLSPNDENIAFGQMMYYLNIKTAK
nr:carbamoyltransferase HypF [Aestuariivivens sediminis]